MPCMAAGVTTPTLQPLGKDRDGEVVKRGAQLRQNTGCMCACVCLGGRSSLVAAKLTTLVDQPFVATSPHVERWRFGIRCKEGLEAADCGRECGEQQVIRKLLEQWSYPRLASNPWQYCRESRTPSIAPKLSERFSGSLPYFDLWRVSAGPRPHLPRNRDRCWTATANVGPNLAGVSPRLASNSRNSGQLCGARLLRHRGRSIDIRFLEQMSGIFPAMLGVRRSRQGRWGAHTG